MTIVPAPSPAAPSPEDGRRAARNVRVLVAAQVILGSQMPVSFVLGGLAGQMLSPVRCLATLPVSLIIFGSMASAPILSALMDRHGRRTGFLIGAAGGAIGGLLCTLALLTGSFTLFLVGSLLSGLYMSAQGFYRFAATDGAEPGQRAGAISRVMAAGLASAIIGPQIVTQAADLLAPVPFAGAYAAVVLLNLVGAPVFLWLRAPAQATARPETHAAPRSRRDLLRDPRIAIAILCATVSYALMNLVMTSTPLAVVGCGFATADAANVVSAHVLAMFAPAFVTGRLIARFGAEKVVAAGLALIALAALAGLSGVTLGHFYLALVLVGLGWNLGFIGATAMLTAAYRPEERGRVQGLNDFIVFGVVGLASLASGGLMNCAAADPVAGWTAVNLATLPLLAAAGGALLWMALRRAR